MVDWKDPTIWVAIGGGVAGLGTFALKTYTDVDNAKRYAERRERVTKLIPEKKPTADSPPGDHFRWAEALDEIDRMTYPRSRPMRAIFALIGSMLTAFAGLLILVFMFLPDSAYSEPPDLTQRVMLIFVSIYLLIIAGYVFSLGNRLLEPSFHMSGRAIKRDSSSLHRVYELRRSLGIATKDDDRAYRRGKEDEGRYERRQQWLERQRVRWAKLRAALGRRSVASRDQRSSRSRFVVGADGVEDLEVSDSYVDVWQEGGVA